MNMQDLSLLNEFLKFKGVGLVLSKGSMMEAGELAKRLRHFLAIG